MMRAGFYMLLFVTATEPQRQSNPIGFQVTPNVGEQSGQQGPIIVANVHAGNRTNKDVEDCMGDINLLIAAPAICHTGSHAPPAQIFNCMKKLRDAIMGDCVMQDGMEMNKMLREACVKIKPSYTEGLWNEIRQSGRVCTYMFTANLALKCLELGCTGMDDEKERNDERKTLMNWCVVPKTSGKLQSYLNRCNSGSAAYLSFLSLIVTIVIAFCLSCEF